MFWQIISLTLIYNYDMVITDNGGKLHNTLHHSYVLVHML